MANTKRRALVLVGIWIALFSASLLIKTLLGSDERDNAAYAAQLESNADAVRIATRAQLDMLPRRSSDPTVRLDEKQHPLLIEGIVSNIRANNDKLYNCVSRTIAKSLVRTNFLELSFVATESSNAAPMETGLLTDRKHILLTHPVLERSTIRFTADEEDCVLRIFDGLDVMAEIGVSGRVSHVVCVTQRPKSGSH